MKKHFSNDLQKKQVQDVQCALWNEIQNNHGYQLLNKLGEGSFGSVFKALNTKNDQIVAIKLIKDPFSNEYQARQLYREIKIMRKFSELDEGGDLMFTP